MSNRATRIRNRREHEAGLSAYQKFRAAQDEGNKPRIYIRVDADTGETVADVDRSRDRAAAEAYNRDHA